MESIYEKIRAAAGKEGVLPQGFSIQPEPTDPNALRFADGAKDGIVFYHAGGGSNKELLERLETITNTVACGGSYEAAATELAACFGENDGMLGCTDGLQEWIVAHRAGLDASRLFTFATALLTQSASLGAIKYALTVLELMAGTKGKWRDVVRALALSDELTLFCAFVASRWDNGDDVLFDMARKTRGWGRIHAIREITSPNEVAEEWLLDEGWNNDVLPAYTALDCAEKGKLMKRLEQPMTRTQLDAAGGLIRALLDEGPCRNFSAMDDGVPLLIAYLTQVQRAEQPNEEDRQTVQTILEAAEQPGLPQLQERARNVLAAINEGSTNV
ncbi:MAG: hypothetical protein HFF50_09945 [Lawsonibacter sp.]|nr:hypothetical protein [Lawsonibacter sp.]